MDKNTFMRELERSLSVLQESELRDILSEYEQHIDMKVKSGLSEEEAIADFGSIPELTAEILEETGIRAADTVYVGDSGVDMQTAKNGGLFAVGALWGFRSEEELRENGADAVAERPLDLLRYIR